MSHKPFFERAVRTPFTQDSEERVKSFSSKDLPGIFKVSMPHGQYRIKGPLRRASDGAVIERERY